jgi:hypothetical protein
MIALSNGTGLDIESIRRLIVLVPGQEADLSSVTYRVWELANATGAHVIFLGLWSDPTEEPGLKRRLITLSAIAHSGRVSADGEIVFGKDWVPAVKSLCQPGDMIVCLAEQRHGVWKRPLSQVLESNLDLPIYILSDLYAQDDSYFSWPARLTTWAGFLAIVLGSLWLQVKIYQLPNNWTALWMVLATALEFWLIWVWNNLFR